VKLHRVGQLSSSLSVNSGHADQASLIDIR
jgi:hypothetical protein